MIQPDLFTLPPALPYAKGSRTSLKGAIGATHRAESQYMRILKHIERMGAYGATNCELKKHTGITESSTMSARLNSLMKEGKIRDSGMERQGDYKAKQTVWIVNS